MQSRGVLLRVVNSKSIAFNKDRFLLPKHTGGYDDYELGFAVILRCPALR